jgi:hypothetical protein
MIGVQVRATAICWSNEMRTLGTTMLAVVFSCVALLGIAQAQAPSTDGPAEVQPMFPYNFVLRSDAPPEIADGNVARGAVIYRAAVRYRRIGTLQNDIRRTALLNNNRVLVQAGTPVFAMRWGAVTTDAAGRTYGFGYRSAWCAVVSDDSQTRKHTFCMLHSYRGEDLVYAPVGGSPYAPALSQMFLPTPGTAADVVDNPSVETGFPSMEVQISFEGWSHDHPNLNVALKIGDEITGLQAGDISRASDGTATLEIPGGLSPADTHTKWYQSGRMTAIANELRATPTPSSPHARIKMLRRPTASAKRSRSVTLK